MTPGDYELLREALDVASVKAHFGSLVKGEGWSASNSPTWVR